MEEYKHSNESFDSKSKVNSDHLADDVYQKDLLDENEVDFKKLWQIIWAGKWKVLFITSIFSVLSIFYSLSLPNIYRSEALLAPNSQESGRSGLSSLAGQFGGLASLAGINLGSGSGDKTVLALQILKSRQFLYNFIKENELSVPIVAAIGWHKPTNQIQYDPSVYDEEKQVWVREKTAFRGVEPSLQEVYKKFLADNLVVTQESDTGMVTISVSHFSPYFSKAVVDKLIYSLNETIKNQELNEAVKSIEYLNRELEKTKVSGMQAMFYQLIEKQQQTLMLTKIRDDYVLKVIDKAIVPELKSKPKRAVICILATLFGGILSIVLVLVQSSRKERVK